MSDVSPLIQDNDRNFPQFPIQIMQHYLKHVKMDSELLVIFGIGKGEVLVWDWRRGYQGETVRTELFEENMLENLDFEHSDGRDNSVSTQFSYWWTQRGDVNNNELIQLSSAKNDCTILAFRVLVTLL
jgi:hypothetical protein